MAELFKLEAVGAENMRFRSGILTGKTFNEWKVNKYVKISYIPPIHIKVFLHTINDVITILDRELSPDKNHEDLYHSKR